MDSEKPPSRGAIKKFREMFPDNPKWTDRVMALCTLLLAFVGILQSWILWNQIHVMHTDQRPWVNATLRLNPISANTPVTAAFRQVNSGKSPAREEHAALVMRFFPNGQEPTLDDPPKKSISTDVGVMYPNDPLESTISMFELGTWDTHKVTAEEWSDFSQGKLFLATYGLITYTDFAGTKHTQHFCEWSYAPTATVPGITARTCTKYNDIDANE